MIYTLQIFTALFLDFLFGDPRWYPHPVKGIGLVCRISEGATRKLVKKQFIAGFFTVAIVLLITGGLVFLFLTACYAVSSIVGDIVAILLLYTTFAAKDLMHHSMDVYLSLVRDSNLASARKAVGRIVGRDTQALSESEVSKACVETVAENMVDGITAPFFFAAVFSLFSPYLGMTAIGCSTVGAFLYKAINTMDSMIGYRNDKYLYFGRVAARVDDFVNFIPARLSGFMLIFAAFILKLDYRGAAKIFIRDRLNHSSPNAGHTEAAVAGALGVRLGGPLLYSGIVVDKPYIGDDIHEIRADDIKTSNKLVLVGSLLFIVIALVLRGIVRGGLIV